ncbi:hypothetical protein ACFSTE_00180 [Aquimarina hainanensis]|uniref:Uncharacterized protein n=1 Tax=Aquimarina hainanensis TaxID=1578017 RepID=A0ABW5N126_9FLAO|nr:hypothetical protein [Aquimarina sp. TRL1]
MKKSFLLILISLVIFSCKQGNTNNNSGETTLIRGEFILIDDVGVIKVQDSVYGVEINDMAYELSKKTTPLQREEYDMVPVVVQGIVKPNPNEGWEKIVEIKEIIGVSEPTSELSTKIKSSEDPHQNHNHE